MNNTDTYYGILILHKNKTYGRHINGKFLYKCIPHKKHNITNIILIPYILKIGFSKVYKNIYVSFKLTDKYNQNIPIGILVENFGEINDLSSYSKYQMNSYQLYKKNKCKITNEYNDYMLEDRRQTHTNIFSIDSKNTVHYDDAFSFKNNIISIYIANVPIIIDILKLWDNINNGNVSNIYFYYNRFLMLNNELCNMCSLTADKTTKYAFIIDFLVEDNNISLKNISCGMINIAYNYCYENEDIIKLNPDYLQLFNALKTIEKITVNNPLHIDIKTPSNVVSYLSNLVNLIMATQPIALHKNINFLDLLEFKQQNISSFLNLSNSLQSFSTSSKKTHYYINNSINNAYTGDINNQLYCHITSPIRRLPDILNMLILQHNLQLFNFSDDALKFYNYWMSLDNIEYLNEQMHKIKKIQNECNLFYKFYNSSIIQKDKIYDGIIITKYFEKDNNNNNNNHLRKYKIYILDLHFIGTLKINKVFEIGDNIQVKLYLFGDEITLTNKIKIELH